MGNEFGTDMSTFNINDYIWYIVGGVALFFVIVGFIADKSGLAKKTFSKNTKKTSNKAEEPVQDVPTHNIGSEFSDMNPAQTESIVEMPVEDDLSYGDNEMNVENDGIIGETEPLYISEEPEVTTDEFGTMEPIIDTFDVDLNTTEVEPVELNHEVAVDEVSNEENVWDETESVVEDLVEDDDNIKINDEDFDIGEDVSMNSLEDTEVGEDDTIISDIAAENAEDEWGVDSVFENNEETDLSEVELPNLEDIEINTEEDVWKF